MEFEILNEILTTSVGSLFLSILPKPRPSQMKEPRNNLTLTKDAPLNNLSKPQNSSKFHIENLTPNKIEEMLDLWVTNEGGRLFKEASRRLKIDLMKLSRKELDKYSEEKLSLEKKRIKNELKNYDMVFKDTFKRFPLKNEKEPMRPLYIYYKTIKEMLEKCVKGQKIIEETNEKVGRDKEREKDKNKEENTKKLAELRKKRDDLRLKFQKYHSEFLKNNNRKIKYAQDIAPIEGDYRVYRSLKEEIARLELMV